LTHNVLNVEAFAIVVEEFVDIFIVELALIKLLATVLIHKVTLISNGEPAMFVNSAGFLINVETLGSLH
jgi:hypothetical protein